MRVTTNSYTTVSVYEKCFNRHIQSIWLDFFSSYLYFFFVVLILSHSVGDYSSQKHCCFYLCLSFLPFVRFDSDSFQYARLFFSISYSFRLILIQISSAWAMPIQRINAHTHKYTLLCACCCCWWKIRASMLSSLWIIHNSKEKREKEVKKKKRNWKYTQKPSGGVELFWFVHLDI